MYVRNAEIMLEACPVVFVVFICSSPLIVDEIVVLPDDLPNRMASAGNQSRSTGYTSPLRQRR